MYIGFEFLNIRNFILMFYKPLCVFCVRIRLFKGYQDLFRSHKNMDSPLYRNVHDENPYENNMDSHSYRNVHDKNPYTKNMDSHLYRNVHDENPYEYG